MSSSTPAPREGKEKRGMDKVLYRVKTVFHRKGSSSRKGASSTPPAPAAASAPLSQPAPPTPPKKLPEYEGATRIPRIQVHEERAKKLGARFGLEIKPSEWHSSEGEVLRVDKPVRMRIHRECHRCKSRFGAGNVCPSCQHTRCKQCTRYPEHQTDAERQANRERREALLQKHKDMAPILPSYDYSPQAQQIVLTRPRKTGTQDLVYKGRPRMRVRRYCHVCENLITSHAKQARTCERCDHKRCADCPRYPDNKKSYPYGYPNDEPGSKFKGVFACHECKTKFDPQAEDGTQCSKCAHEKCSECPRVKPRRVEPEPDPEVLESLRLRMAALQTSES
ncbi:hypothetical protein F5B22DRAFT_588528 [Xylaria bambusicola]|uniref:uncharacterized protein n=1 Tax=Xylaria bambusicola TaxID=326684 RepID=UPI00200778CF|nr:uncharacterized protein F5B22DRAFT_588528 [Xylaria bambusicola]KAI0525976.1 hypothetical protein F5B22DRAFT_588528 [Xylaria bambusicola]